MANDFDQRLKQWESEGWNVEKRRGGHLMLLHPNAAKPVFCASTPSDWRAIYNIEAELRRAIGRSEKFAEETHQEHEQVLCVSRQKLRPKPVSTQPKHRKYFIPYRPEEVNPEVSAEDLLPLFERTNKRLRADVWRWQFLQMRIANREIALIHIIRRRIMTDDDFFQRAIQNFSKNGILETIQMRTTLRARGSIPIAKQTPNVEPETMPVARPEMVINPGSVAATQRRRKGGIVKGGLSRRRPQHNQEYQRAAE